MDRENLMQKFDLVIRGGYVVDGTGCSGKYCDIGINGDTVIEIGPVS